MDTTPGEEEGVWKRLATIAFLRRDELGLTQEELARRFGVSLGTIQRLEEGVQQTRRGTTWPKLEAGYGWGPGFIANFTKGRVTEPPVTEGGGRFIRTPRPDGAVDIRDIVRQVLGKFAPETTISDVIRAEEEAVSEARRRGLIGPDTRETEDADETPATP